MTKFAHKTFNGITYTFDHLHARELSVELKPPSGVVEAKVQVLFGCHCFTEEFDDGCHGDQHRYTHRGELRAFDLQRYACSLQLPALVDAMTQGKVYRSAQSYTYVTQIQLPPAVGQHSYSLFFSLEKEPASTIQAPRATMFIKSAYMRDLAAPKNAPNWRYSALLGINTGVYVPVPKPRPTKKSHG